MALPVTPSLIIHALVGDYPRGRSPALPKIGGGAQCRIQDPCLAKLRPDDLHGFSVPTKATNVWTARAWHSAKEQVFSKASLMLSVMCMRTGLQNTTPGALFQKGSVVLSWS